MIGARTAPPYIRRYRMRRLRRGAAFALVVAALVWLGGLLAIKVIDLIHPRPTTTLSGRAI
ncbi:MAG: hypothetical protein U1A72_16950, partial [Sulfuritalea sp.]|nr:hypothetical protein [Sulfuritalea sp.]